MTRDFARVVATGKSRSPVYLRRARNLTALMEQASASKNNDGAAILGVQAAISYSDAFTVARLGLRSRGQDHREAIRLIASVGTPGASKLAALVQTVLSKKSEVEYGDREVTSKDSTRITSAVREIRDLIASEL